MKDDKRKMPFPIG